MADTKIEWADACWNPVSGCSKVSEGCRNCYAERMAKRLAGRCGYPTCEPFKVTVHMNKLDEPLGWRKNPGRVFVNSMSDLFHPDIPDGVIQHIFTTMGLAGWTFLVLTKRPERMVKILSDRAFQEAASYVECDLAAGELPWPFPNVWLGVSAENQQTADERIPLLLRTPAVVRFVSCEPLLGPVDLQRLPFRGDTAYVIDALRGRYGEMEPVQPFASGLASLGTLDWVIAGGETGTGARPAHPDWFRSLRDQCTNADVPFFFKSWGDWKPIGQMEDGECDALYHPAPERDPEAARRCKVETTVLQLDGSERREWPPGAMQMFRVGKKRAGRLLDGMEHGEFPEIRT